MEKIVAANLKMNMTFNEIQEYIEKIKEYGNNKNFIVFPTSMYIPYFLNKPYSVGSQDIDINDAGEFTGALSPKQVASIGIKYTLVGHSERRKHYNETDEVVNKKIQAGLRNNLKVILCIGESLDERNNNQTKEKLKNQLINGLKDINDLSNVMVAYEPIWAIGTGIIPTYQDIKATAIAIKEIVNIIKNVDIPVLYGGSVNETNIDNINSIEEISGVLVGTASLKPERLKIVKEVVLG